jgi:hypothetical protein
MTTKISKSDIINRITTRIKDYVTSQTNWVAGTAVWNRNVGFITANSASYGGPYSRTTSADNIASPQMIGSDLPNKLQASTTGLTVVTVLRNFLLSYANNHRIKLQNTGNLTPATYFGVAKLNDLVQVTKDQITTDVNAAAVANNIMSNKTISGLEIDGFIDDCKNIWINRCFTTPPEVFYYGFCHSSCHSNHGSHGSRGRR